MATNDAVFSGSVPALYDLHLGPLLFEPYAADIAGRLADLAAGEVLETASGTGIVTRALLERLPSAVGLTATDLNQAMLDYAAKKPGMARASLRQADALALPFPDGHFDAVVCQFGAMFFPDRVAGYREARRVLKPGGRFLFNIWCDLSHNVVAQCVHETVAGRFPGDPPGFLGRTPYGHHDTGIIRAELAKAGFGQVALDTVDLPCQVRSARDPAVGFCQGSPLRGEIEARAPQDLAAVTDAAEAALVARFGGGSFSAPQQAHVMVARK